MLKHVNERDHELQLASFDREDRKIYNRLIQTLQRRPLTPVERVAKASAPRSADRECGCVNFE